MWRECFVTKVQTTQRTRSKPTQKTARQQRSSLAYSSPRITSSSVHVQLTNEQLTANERNIMSVVGGMQRRLAWPLKGVSNCVAVVVGARRRLNKMVGVLHCNIESHRYAFDIVRITCNVLLS